MVRPVAGVWERVDSRPLPPALRFGEGAARFFAVFFFFATAFCFGAAFFALDGFGRLALDAAALFFGADALLDGARLAAFFFVVFALPAGFLAI
jgi:hypothetical protein